MFKSFKTTWAGVLAALGIIVSAVALLVDGDPMTNPNWGEVIPMILASLGLIAARDNDVSSEQAGAK